MAKNILFEDNSDGIQLPVIAGTLSGSPVIVGMLVGVALTDRDVNGNASIGMNKTLKNASVTATGSITIGQPIFITVASYALSDSAGTGKELYGHAVSASTGTGTKSINVRVADYSVPTDTAA